MKVTNDTLSIKKREDDRAIQIEYANPNELQLFIDKMPASIKGKIVKYNFLNFV